jgi:intracellular septation protein
MTAPDMDRSVSETHVTQTVAQPRRRTLNPVVKFALELGPLALFFVANSKPGLFHGLVGGLLPADLPPDKVGMLTATAVLIPVTFVALIISFALTRRLPVMPVVTAGMVLVFGGLTFWLQDKTFIEIKLTIIYCLFGTALLGSMAFGKLLLPIVLDTAFHLDPAGWRQLTIRWGLFFFALAGLNEVLRHALNWDQWVAFKTFGVLPLTLAFALAQAPLIMRHETKEDAFSDEM